MEINLNQEFEQVKVIEEFGFDYVGEVFTITKVDDHVVMGRGCGVGFGIDRAKFSEYFSPVVKETDEQKVVAYENYKVIQNGLATIVILNDGSKGVSKCLPIDTYDADKGFEIAHTKAQIKSLNKKLKKLIK